MYSCCCFFNCCNMYSCKCIELSILILSSITFICSILGFICIKWAHLTTVCSLLLILIILFTTILEISSLSINIFRCKATINTKRNNLAKYLSIITLIICIIIITTSLITESLIQKNFKKIDFPCKDISKDDHSNQKFLRYLSKDILANEEKIEFCKNKNSDYNAKICSNLEYSISYFTSTIIEICSLLLCFFIVNDYRRIKGKLDGEFAIKTTTNINMVEDPYKNNNKKDEEGESNDRYLNQNNLIKSNVVLVNNNIIKTEPLVLNMNKNNENNTKNNFIKNIRKEMKDAIKSLEEESSNNKKEKNNDIKMVEIDLANENNYYNNIDTSSNNNN